MPDEVARQQLLVLNGEVMHYDFLEASVQEFERSVQLARLVPGHVGEGFNDACSSGLIRVRRGWEVFEVKLS